MKSTVYVILSCSPLNTYTLQLQTVGELGLQDLMKEANLIKMNWYEIPPSNLPQAVTPSVEIYTYIEHKYIYI
jgi:hypothetical protein